MTIREALKARIPRVRQSQWANPNAYLRLPLFKDGLHGPWTELYDDGVQQDVLGVRPGSQRLLTLFMLDDEVEPYIGPVSPFEQHAENYARVYSET